MQRQVGLRQLEDRLFPLAEDREVDDKVCTGAGRHAAATQARNSSLCVGAVARKRYFVEIFLDYRPPASNFKDRCRTLADDDDGVTTLPNVLARATPRQLHPPQPPRLAARSQCAHSQGGRVPGTG